MQSLKGLVAMVTGGASGFGLSTAERLVQQGARVVLCDVNATKGREVAATIGEESVFVETDVTSETDVKKALEVCSSKFQKLDILVNCAGTSVLSKTYDFANRAPHSLEKFTKMLEVNTVGTFNVIRLSVGLMSKNVPDSDGQKDVIVNLTSCHAFEGGSGHVAFACRDGNSAPIAQALAKSGPCANLLLRHILVNTVGTFNVMRLCVGLMSKNVPDVDGQKGVIVNLTSCHAFEGGSGHVAFAASSGCIAAMTLPVARDLASEGIRCCAIAAGHFDTPYYRSLPEKYRRFLPSVVPFPRGLGSPREFAHLVQTCVENRMLNGEVVRLDAALRVEL